MYILAQVQTCSNRNWQISFGGLIIRFSSIFPKMALLKIKTLTNDKILFKILIHWTFKMHILIIFYFPLKFFFQMNVNKNVLNIFLIS